MNNFLANFKNPLLVLVAFFVLLFIYTKSTGPIPFSINSVTTTKEDDFQVSGEGKVTAIPNVAKINLGLTADGQSIPTVQSEVNNKINKLSQDLKNLGIDPKDIKTQNYQVNPKYKFLEGSQKVSGFTVTVNLEVKVTNLEKINQVIDTATTNGANLIGGLNLAFDDKTKEELTAQAREKAVEAAKNKARGLAKAAGVSLGKIINVSESQPGGPPIVLEERAQAAGGETQIQPGTAEIRVEVTLSYQIL